MNRREWSRVLGVLAANNAAGAPYAMRAYERIKHNPEMLTLAHNWWLERLLRESR